MATTTEDKNIIKESDTIFDDAIAEVESIYGSDGLVQQGINSYQQSQNQLLDQQDSYLVSQLDQQKKNLEQSYTQEQSAAYTDYQKQVDPYGAQAEQMASSGLSNSGYAESLKTQSYVAYQNRVAVARQSMEQARVSFENAFTEAKMQNDSSRATLAYQVYQMQLEAALTGFQYKNQLIMDKANARLNLATQYPDQWLEVLEQVYASPTSTEQSTIENTEASTSHWYVKDRDSTISLLESAGVNFKPMTEDQWNMGHNAKTPLKDYNYATYQEYLNAFVKKYLGG